MDCYGATVTVHPRVTGLFSYAGAMGHVRLYLGLSALSCGALLGCGQDHTLLHVPGFVPAQAADSVPPSVLPPSTLPPSTPPPSSMALPGEEAFADGQVLTVQLTMDPASFRELEEHGNREQYVVAAARLEGAGLGRVELAELGVRHKGSYTLHHCWDNFGGVRSYLAECAKLSFKLKFDFVDSGLRFDGLKRLNLHAASGDLSKLRDLMAYQLYRDFGVDAPRAVPARLYVNGAFKGLFIAVEDVDGRYARAHYPEGPNGNLYKEVWPNPGADEASFLAALQTNEDLGDVTDLRAFANAVGQSTDATFDADMEPHVELEAILRYIAVDRALRNWDGIMAFYSPWSPHNFYWYRDDGPEPRFHLIPWDLDNALWAFDPYMQPQQWVTAEPIPDFNSAPLDCEPRPIWEPASPVRVTPPRCDPFLDRLARIHWPRLVELSRELLEGPFAEAKLHALADRWEPLVAPIVAEDPTLDLTAWQAGVSELHNVLAGIGPGFRSFLDQGLISEVREGQLTQLSPAELAVATSDTGFQVGLPTNFEFVTPPASGVPVGVYTYADPLATSSALWSAESPIAGTADLRFDFTFNRGPEPYDEWAGISIEGPEVDMRGRSALVVWLSSDVPREVRIRLSSPAYDEEFGEILPEFSSDDTVGPETRAVIIDLRNFSYPDWAKLLWTGQQGFPGTNAEALSRVLERANGVIISPLATVDPTGELASDIETGHLRIDNIYFL
jgi:hypothetical protein